MLAVGFNEPRYPRNSDGLAPSQSMFSYRNKKMKLFQLSSMTTPSLVGQLINWTYFYTRRLMKHPKQLDGNIGAL